MDKMLEGQTGHSTPATQDKLAVPEPSLPSPSLDSAFVQQPLRPNPRTFAGCPERHQRTATSYGRKGLDMGRESPEPVSFGTNGATNVR